MDAAQANALRREENPPMPVAPSYGVQPARQVERNAHLKFDINALTGRAELHQAELMARMMNERLNAPIDVDVDDVLGLRTSGMFLTYECSDDVLEIALARIVDNRVAGEQHGRDTGPQARHDEPEQYTPGRDREAGRITHDQAAAALGLSSRTLYRYQRSDKLPESPFSAAPRSGRGMRSPMYDAQYVADAKRLLGLE
jgi:hypothetical protein